MQTKQQHYVPRFLLKNFTSGKKSQIWVYDKQRDISFRTNIKNIAAEKGFYNLENIEPSLSFESGLSRLEDRASSIVSELLRSRNLKTLTDESRVTFSYFLAVQFFRTKEHRLILDALTDGLVDRLKKMGAGDEDVERVVGPKYKSKLLSFRSIAKAKDFVAYFLAKTWIIFETKSSAPLYISDNPITLHNRQDYTPYGNLGLAVPGIEIYFPVSTRICLGFICPSIGEEIAKAYQNFQVLDQINPDLANRLLQDPTGTREYCTGVVNGTALSLTLENVTMLNSLQVTFSSRFVYCETDSFDLVREMINDNPKFRRGLKPTIG